MELDHENLTSSQCPQNVYGETANTDNIFYFELAKSRHKLDRIGRRQKLLSCLVIKKPRRANSWK
jgi:hypothetical protein